MDSIYHANSNNFDGNPQPRIILLTLGLVLQFSSLNAQVLISSFMLTIFDERLHRILLKDIVIRYLSLVHQIGLDRG